MNGLICFQSLLNTTLAAVPPQQMHAVPLPAQMAYAVKSQKGHLRLDAQFFELSDLGGVRSVIIASPKIEILIHFFFPLSHLDLPVYAMEFVAMSGKPIVAVMDIKNLLPEMASEPTARALLNSVHEQYPHCVNDVAPPDWYRACRSGSDFFVRPQHLTDFEMLGEAHFKLWSGLIDFMREPQSLPTFGVSAHNEALQAYKSHHRVNSPGLPLMHSTFGKQWTSEFLESYLFA